MSDVITDTAIDVVDGVTDSVTDIVTAVDTGIYMDILTQLNNNVFALIVTVWIVFLTALIYSFFKSGMRRK